MGEEPGAEEEAEVEEEPAVEDEPEIDEELQAEGEKLLLDAVQALSAGDMDRILRGLPTAVSTEVAADLIGNKLDPRRLKNLSSLLIGPLQKRPVARLTLVIERLSIGILETFHSELGERFDNPSVDDLRGVLDAVVSHHPVSGVRCTLSWVVAEQMPAARAARDILLTDERLRLPDWAEVS